MRCRGVGGGGTPFGKFGFSGLISSAVSAKNLLAALATLACLGGPPLTAGLAGCSVESSISPDCRIKILLPGGDVSFRSSAPMRHILCLSRPLMTGHTVDNRLTELLGYDLRKCCSIHLAQRKSKPKSGFICELARLAQNAETEHRNVDIKLVVFVSAPVKLSTKACEILDVTAQFQCHFSTNSTPSQNFYDFHT